MESQPNHPKVKEARQHQLATKYYRPGIYGQSKKSPDGDMPALTRISRTSGLWIPNEDRKWLLILPRNKELICLRCSNNQNSKILLERQNMITILFENCYVTLLLRNDNYYVTFYQ